MNQQQGTDDKIQMNVKTVEANEEDGNNDTNKTPNNNNEDLQNRISNVEEELERDKEELNNVTAHAPVAKRTRSQLSCTEVLFQQKTIKS